ncbi:GNAT family N-acetyltransferase [Lysobacter sp. TY2-98]|uniref:GNAT family N-acetyltransferase n=1 Tax=Lysobacter sp. TY2-98 TaxID=2290922 RepID=UPI000E208DA5|nr:GNAT family N-acetyltransferase [Lysobacter sp. TY2-98]AXK72902.1 GNAT family N-acetyltransferase [Lysobacter sp. TY2-98]
MSDFNIVPLRPDDAMRLGRLMVAAYSALEGFPTPDEQPQYYALLADVARFAKVPGATVFTALDEDDTLLGGVVYFADMAHYGAGGVATQERQAAGFRLLAVDPALQGRGVGKRLTQHCIDQARRDGRREVILHTTAAMKPAWAMYERLGFRRSEDLDFLQQGFPVYGFRLAL